MAQIKSALELALEKTKDVKLDEAALAASQARQEGKKAAGRFLDEPESVDLGKKLEEADKERRPHLKAGMHDILSSQIQLPTNDGGIDKLARVSQAYAAIAKSAGPIAGALAEKRLQNWFGQVDGFFRKYLEDMRNVDQVIRKQWAPKLREKERAMSARMGQDVRLDPMMDQEFAAFYKQNVGAVREQYQAAVDEAKNELGALIGVVAE
jgi:hypothetical protein